MSKLRSIAKDKSVSDQEFEMIFLGFISHTEEDMLGAAQILGRYRPGVAASLTERFKKGGKHAYKTKTEAR